MLKNRFKHFIGRYPSFFIPFYRYIGPKKNQKLLFQNDTQLVIEGFPRSANTFAVVAFELAQAEPVKIAHHLHVESQLIAAAANEIPAVALIRNPEDSFRSLIIRHPETSIDWLIDRYMCFYGAVLQLGPKCLVVDYEEVTNDMGLIISKINQRFGTDFDIPVHDQSMIDRVFKEVEAINFRIDHGKETHVARPSVERKEQSQSIDLDSYRSKIDQAIVLYESLMPKL